MYTTRNPIYDLDSSSQLEYYTNILLDYTTIIPEIVNIIANFSIVCSFNPFNYQSLYILKGHTDIVTCIFLLNDSNIVSGSHDKTLRIWNYNNDKFLCKGILTGHNGFVTSLLQLSSQPQFIISGDYLGYINIWNIKQFTNDKNHEKKQKPTYRAHFDNISSLIELSDGYTWASGSDDCTIKLYISQLPLLTCIKIISTEKVYRLVALKSNYIACGYAYNSFLNIFDTNSGDKIRSFPHSNSVSALKFIQENLLLSGSWDKSIRLWHIDSGKCALSLKGHTEIILNLCVFPNNDLIASISSDYTVRFWRLSSKECIHIIKMKELNHCIESFSNGWLILASRDITIYG